jgi:phosphatidylglycerophosphate synthase
VSSDLEEAVDKFIHRPAAQILVRHLVATRITPNQITILSGLVGVVAGVLMVRGADRPSVAALGGFALLVSCILDCADGQLARSRNTQSPLGMILDGVTDNVVGTAVFVAMSYNAVVYAESEWVWLLGVTAGVSIAAHVWVFDAKKKQYLELLGLAAPEEPIAAVKERQQQARADGRHLEAFLWSAFVFFRSAQSVGVTAATARDPMQFWQQNRRRMRAWTMLGSGTHFFLLYFAAALYVFWPPAFLACALFYVVPMNLLYVWLVAGNWKTA